MTNLFIDQKKITNNFNNVTASKSMYLLFRSLKVLKSTITSAWLLEPRCFYTVNEHAGNIVYQVEGRGHLKFTNFV